MSTPSLIEETLRLIEQQQQKKKKSVVRRIAPPAAPAPPPPPPKPPVKEEIPQWRCFKEFETPLELLMALNEYAKPYKWQVETLVTLAALKERPTSANPLYYNLLAINGSGKDTRVINAFGIWFAACKIRSKVIVTSSSYNQLKTQTFEYFKALAEAFNRLVNMDFFEIVEFSISSKVSGSSIIFFCTDTPGNVEGQHPFDDWPDAEMAVIINEAKSIDDELFKAFERFTGFNYWLEVSSPGSDSGHFYQRYMMSIKHPAKLQLGSFYARKIIIDDCPHLGGARLKNLKLQYGEDSQLFRNMCYAEFMTSGADVFIPKERLNYAVPDKKINGWPIVAGIDLSMGGDETVVCVIRGNLLLHMEHFNSTDADTIHSRIARCLKEWKVEYACADGGGLGKPIISRLKNAGFEIREVFNQSPAIDKAAFANRGAELYQKLSRLVMEQVLILPEDDILIAQLTSRRCITVNGKVKCEAKPDARKRGDLSPDRADAYALAYNCYPLSDLLNATPPGEETAEPTGELQTLILAATKRQLSLVEMSNLQDLYTQRVATLPNEQVQQQEAITAQMEYL